MAKKQKLERKRFKSDLALAGGQTQEESAYQNKPHSYGNSEQTRLGTVEPSNAMDMSGNVYTGGPTGKRKDNKPLKKRVIQVQGQKPPPSDLVLKPGSPEVLTSETTTGQTGLIYGVPQSPLVMITDPSVVNLYKKYFTTYDEYRRIRLDPTIALCRAVIAAPILSSVWTVNSKEGVGKELVQFITDQVVKRRFHIMEKAVYGMIDFGWQGFEKVFAVDMWAPPAEDPKPDADKEQKQDPAKQAIQMAFGGKAKSKISGDKMTTGKPKKMIVLRKIKPLLQDMTTIMVYLYTGDFAGFRQGIVFVEAPAKAVLMSFRTEGTMWHGYPLLEEARQTVEKWNNVEVGAQRYDQKIAGSHFVIHYPMGSSEVNGQNVSNQSIAHQLLAALQASGSIAVPRALASFVEGFEGGDAETSAWKVELLSDTGARQSSFVDRARYLDTCKVRAMNLPERALTESQFGSKADSQGHADLMALILSNLDERITLEVNQQIVNQLLALNYGKEYVDSVWLKSSPISDDKIGYVRTVFSAIMANQQGFPAVFPHLDINAIMKEIEVPANKEVIKVAGQPETGQVPLGQPGQPAPGQPGGVPPMGQPQQQLVNKMNLQPGQPQPLGKLSNALKQLNAAHAQLTGDSPTPLSVNDKNKTQVAPPTKKPAMDSSDDDEEVTGAQAGGFANNGSATRQVSDGKRAPKSKVPTGKKPPKK